MKLITASILATCLCACYVPTPAQKDTARVWSEAYKFEVCNKTSNPSDAARCNNFNNEGRQLFNLENIQ